MGLLILFSIAISVIINLDVIWLAINKIWSTFTISSDLLNSIKIVQLPMYFSFYVFNLGVQVHDKIFNSVIALTVSYFTLPIKDFNYQNRMIGANFGSSISNAFDVAKECWGGTLLDPSFSSHDF